MSGLFDKTIQLFTGGVVAVDSRKKKPLSKYTERDLLRKESAIGRQLFGTIPAGHQREFFCLDERTWIWYEFWEDPETKQPKEQTTRFEIHTNGIIKIQENQPYRVLEGQELQNFEAAVKAYHDRVMKEVYRRNPATGEVFPSVVQG